MITFLLLILIILIFKNKINTLNNKIFLVKSNTIIIKK